MGLSITPGSAGYTYILDDISSKFDGITKSFLLTYDGGTSISPNNPSKLQVIIGGVSITPTKYVEDFLNLPELAVFNSGFIVSGSTITFATAPSSNMKFYGTVKANSDPVTTFSYSQVPYNALNIMLRS